MKEATTNNNCRNCQHGCVYMWPSNKCYCPCHTNNKETIEEWKQEVFDFLEYLAHVTYPPLGDNPLKNRTDEERLEWHDRQYKIFKDSTYNLIGNLITQLQKEVEGMITEECACREAGWECEHAHKNKAYEQILALLDKYKA